jgi:dihydrofolate reductase
MQTLTIDLFSSLDGFGVAEGWPGYWGKEGPELLEWQAARLREDHTLIMGANTYKDMLEIATASSDVPVFKRMAEIPKIVFSKSITGEPTWANTTIVREDAVTTIRDLKTTSPVPLRTSGSISLGNALLTAGLVDSIEIVIFPVITGQTGRTPLFDGGPDLDLDLLETKTLDGRMQWFKYVPQLHE